MKAIKEVQVVSITEPADDTPLGRLLEAIIESLNEFYSQNLGQEISQGMLERCQSGLLLHSRIPYGYRRVKVEDGRVLRDRVEPDPQIAPVAAWMFRQVLRGWSLKWIGRDLNARGILAPQGSRGATRCGWRTPGPRL